MAKVIEKRLHQRMNYNTRISLESLQFGIDENARMLNCSDDGLYFESDQFLQPGSEIFIRIENVQDSLEDYKCHHATIRWGKRLKNTPFVYGYGAKYVNQSIEHESLEIDLGQKIDLRKHPRKYYDKPVSFQFENKSYDGFISDISRNGCFIENREFFDNIGQILDLVIPGTKFGGDTILQVEVVRLSPIGVGVKFKRIKKRKPNKLGSTTRTKQKGEINANN
jgi:hypothetical protein